MSNVLKPGMILVSMQTGARFLILDYHTFKIAQLTDGRIYNYDDIDMPIEYSDLPQAQALWLRNYAVEINEHGERVPVCEFLKPLARTYKAGQKVRPCSGTTCWKPSDECVIMSAGTVHAMIVNVTRNEIWSFKFTPVNDTNCLTEDDMERICDTKFKWRDDDTN